ncbi:MAG: aminodeoxychorismate synthase component I [Planctomycetes bacterium]|nr:aminodeoxychorismate synthase component I [Planctomycetota bacterium]
MLTEQDNKAKLVMERIDKIASLPILLARLDNRPGVFVMGDFDRQGTGRFSYLGLKPVEQLTFEQNGEGDPFEILNLETQKYQLDSTQDLPAPFVGGWVGYLSYDLARYIERLPDNVNHDIPLPLMYFGFYDAIAAWDNQQKCGYLLALDYPGQRESTVSRRTRLRALCQVEDESEKSDQVEDKQQSATLQYTAHLVRQMESGIEHQAYLDKVARAIEYIKAGDIFEVNISQRFACPYQESPSVLYEYLARHNPAGYATLIVAADHAVISASPELFLSRRGSRIITRPIKGTAPRGANEQEDRVNREWLLHSDKDRSELNMIIDLERNDLGRICQYGTVKVLAEREIEEHPTVLHTVSTIAGDLWDKTGISDIFRATFPGGSITGAPKIRSMEIIDELEPTARSVYTGSIGWIGINGDMDLNIAIRTIILSAQKAYAQVGGAIVADSDPQAEYDETLAKAAALVRALWATGNAKGKIK